ncbi:NAD(P)/FAD-dependent oxidoreductase [Janibacter cremeus]|uniref:D-amino-acid dehydrogenase n=1 Tax=Janibacter cremeus TaxID=1285192 RepID=A0A852VQD5_9MICO|nr:FAD-dependent oxidoreductase [Janibacter cremeus]NYF97978.1 D-amino-acid dehydrogenase [Janibacter cremeus]
MNHPTPPPTKVAIIGAGMVGLSTAWFLQEHGVEVEVLDRDGVAAGSSWGNAGWITPGLSTPLPDPAVLSYGIKAVVSPSSPVYVPVTGDPRLLRFLAKFTRNSTMRRWSKSMRALVPINECALPAFDELTAGGVSSPVHEATSFIAGYRTRAETEFLRTEFEHIAASGQEMGFEELTGEQVREIEPTFSTEVGAGIRLLGQRYLNPIEYTHALADSVRARGGKIRDGADVTGITDEAKGVRLAIAGGGSETFDRVVVATGTWLDDLVRPFGVRTHVQAGRGYSFSVPIDHVPHGPVYLPNERVACTPLGDRLRVAGMMEFRPPEAPLDQRRVEAVVEAARPFLSGVDLDDRQDEWVGSRPCTPDGLPLIGASSSPHVHVAGGHGMWGMTLGPATGQLLAKTIVTGRPAPELTPFDPRR